MAGYIDFVPLIGFLVIIGLYLVFWRKLVKTKKRFAGWIRNYFTVLLVTSTFVFLANSVYYIARIVQNFDAELFLQFSAAIDYAMVALVVLIFLFGLRFLYTIKELKKHIYMD